MILARVSLHTFKLEIIDNFLLRRSQTTRTINLHIRTRINVSVYVSHCVYVLYLYACMRMCVLYSVYTFPRVCLLRIMASIHRCTYNMHAC